MDESNKTYVRIHLLITNLLTTGSLSLLLNYLTNGKLIWDAWLKIWAIVFVLVLILSQFVPKGVHLMLKTILSSCHKSGEN
ncbi:MAG: hypothetical protein L0F95_02955 [Lactococcus sp.]|nr:hypothetical protein [Lactococcus sp.]MDN5410703.1 hypothetical protein [Lactococcus sp.]MDN5411358.1 hypothetical protein [Lactococcus sp.]MDN5436370.1 hypothetical protein [Lactococcus sp.]MDN5462459.1 hypothetical protein [Lactococcus sp.]MDN5466865.1 hypothetical protein [Lactococcus sp.]